ncbi:MAG TPA: NYN domain-containing protein [Syntrophales bacterium]|nr:NYN domain-containing protein [Syntrophales bacterium]
MHILIDGYNLIRQSDSLRRHERLSLEEGRRALIRFMAGYRKQKGHKVTVVFDGWENGPIEEERDRQGGIDIIYSRRGEKADDVIKRYVERPGEEIIVVTSDRGIADFVIRRGVTAISSHEFEEFAQRLQSGPPDSSSYTEGRYDKDKDDEITTNIKKKGPSRRLSRKKKAAIIKLRKL